jgi:hypothetical protein
MVPYPVKRNVNNDLETCPEKLTIVFSNNSELTKSGLYEPF